MKQNYKRQYSRYIWFSRIHQWNLLVFVHCSFAQLYCHEGQDNCLILCEWTHIRLWPHLINRQTDKLSIGTTTIDSTTNWDINSFSSVKLCNRIYHELTLCNPVNSIYSNHCRFQLLLIIVHLFFHFQLKEVLRECQLLYCFNEFLVISLAP
jgi:hypothetical protein